MSKQQIKELLSSLNLLFIALFGGSVLFLGVAIYLVNTGFSPVDEKNATLLTAIPFVYAFIAFVVSYFVFNFRIKKVTPEMALFQKLFEYRNIALLRLVILEGGVLLACTMYLLTGNTLLFIVIGVLLGIMWWYKPEIGRISNELGLHLEEQNELRSL